MEALKKVGYLILFAVVMYLLSIYMIKLFGWILNIGILFFLIYAAFWLYQKIKN